jgi:pimeloyl-ACP methyl ester carboxylesterase
MAERRPMSDIVVLIPGILGSVLVDKDGREVWGASGKSIAHNLITFGKSLNSLELPSGVGHDDPKDGIVAPRTLPNLGMIPRLMKVDGYGILSDYLKKRFAVTPSTDDQAGNLVEFSYDWRLSNRVNAERFRDRIIPALDRWRKLSNNSEAKLILICHSMGGLVARYFLEVLNGSELTRKLITIGTPYCGSVDALDALANGLFLGLGSIGVSVDKLVRSFPSVYQLLPTYKCLDVGDGKLRELIGGDLEHLGDRKSEVVRALEFHSKIDAAIDPSPKYDTYVLKGVDQPTSQSALLQKGRIKPLKSYGGKNTLGDGTVPRPSSHPPEWKDEGSSIFVSQSHAVLQSTQSILTQVFGMLTGNLGRFMGGTGIGLDVPELVKAGEPLTIEARSQLGNMALALQAHCHGEDGAPRSKPVLMRPLGDGSYSAKFAGFPEGAYRFTVQSATPARPIEPVSDWCLAWEDSASR